MRQIKSNFFISLDGVVDSPDEWHFPYFDEEMGAAVGECADLRPGRSSMMAALLGHRRHPGDKGAKPALRLNGLDEFDDVVPVPREILLDAPSGRALVERLYDGDYVIGNLFPRGLAARRARDLDVRGS